VDIVKGNRVKCDSIGCEWKKNISFSEVPLWHNKLCPFCAGSVIINDNDLLIWKSLNVFVQSFKSIADVPGIPKKNIIIDTSLFGNR